MHLAAALRKDDGNRVVILSFHSVILLAYFFPTEGEVEDWVMMRGSCLGPFSFFYKNLCLSSVNELSGYQRQQMLSVNFE